MPRHLALVILLVSLVVVDSAWAAVTLDTTASNKTLANTTTLDVSITIAAGNSNRCLIVLTEATGGETVSGISGAGATWQGSAAGTQAGTGTKIEIWAGTAPSTGAQTVTITWDASRAGDGVGVVYSVFNCNQATPVANYVSSTGTQTVTVTTASGDMAVSSSTYGVGAPTVSNCTTTVDVEADQNLFNAYTSCAASGASTAFAWSGTGLRANQGVDVQQSVGLVRRLLLGVGP